jgi:hypothetical protein
VDGVVFNGEVVTAWPQCLHTYTHVVKATMLVINIGCYRGLVGSTS